MIRDITRTLTNGFPTWPGDPVFSLERAVSLTESDSCDVTRITMSAHAGTHLDAPSHVVAGAGDLTTISLDLLVGPALVVHARESGAIPAGSLRAAIERWGGGAENLRRLLIWTGSARTGSGRTDSARKGSGRTPAEFPAGFATLAIESARYVVDAGIRLVGIDTPSVDDPRAADLPVHRILAEAGVAILEWLDLDQVPEGMHHLVALPLKLHPCEASPVRAILIDPA